MPMPRFHRRSLARAAGSRRRWPALAAAAMMSASLPLSAAGAGGLPLPCGADYSQLYCRGQLALDTGSGEYIVSFSKNAIGAGTMGRTRAAGSCAFSDRPLTSDEPSQIVGGQFIQTRSGDILDPAYSAI